MELIKNILKKNEEQQQIDAFNYLYDRLKIGRHRNMSMQEYFDRQYKHNCYYYSTYILMCMKPTDRLVRGNIHLGGENDFVSRIFNGGNKVPNFKHGWVEFEFNNKWWVYDDHYIYPILMEKWYNMKSPYEVYKKFTQSELIAYVKENFPDKVKEIKQGNKTFISTEIITIKEYNLPLWWIDLEIENGEIVKFEQDKNMKECLC